MSWQTEMTTVFRNLINDVDSPQTYTDERLQGLIVSAAQLTTDVVDYEKDYTIDVVNNTITPDPTASPRDDVFFNLVLLKAACLLATGDYRSASNKAISIKDGPSTIDAKGIADHKKQVMTDWCDAYTKAVFDYRMGNSKAGEAIVGPHRASAVTRTSHGDFRNRFS